MKKISTLLISLLCIFLYRGEAFAISERGGKVVLDMHNQTRESLGLGKLSWNKRIALSAQIWADTLAQKNMFQHSDSRSRAGRGENIYMIWSTGGDLQSDGSDAMMSWLDEISFYDYGSNSCERGKVCGHYTQIVWRTSTQIGCGKAVRNIGNTRKIYWVCQYDPPGNYIGQRPY